MRYELIFALMGACLLLCVLVAGSAFWSLIIDYRFDANDFAVIVAGRRIWSIRYEEMTSVKRISRLQTLSAPFALYLGTSVFRHVVVINSRKRMRVHLTPDKPDAFIETMNQHRKMRL